MAEKNFNARFKQKHDIEANWAKASFVPLAGEFIVYDTDENNPLPRIKIGDGETQINDLPFVGNGETSGIKKIGFTSDCDYIATSTDGLTAFTQAISEAAVGDTILVMPGTYISSSTLTIAKNINFVGVGMPTISFAITISGSSSAVYETNWKSIEFTGVINSQGYTDENDYYSGGGSTFNTLNCVFRDITSTIAINGNHRNDSFENINGIGANGTAVGISFYNCEFRECVSFGHSYTGGTNYYSCTIRNQTKAFSLNEYGYGGHFLNNTNIYNYNASSNLFSGGNAYNVYLCGCSIFGIMPNYTNNETFTSATFTNTYHYAGSIPGDASTAIVTQSSMESYVDDTINRTTSVDEADTNYSTYMARGTSLNSTETTPAANGTVAWTYE